MAQVLVTGGSGFVGAHCLLQLLQAGHAAHTTVRERGREEPLRALLSQGLKPGGAGEAGERLRVFAADLSADEGWADAAAGCDYVLHVASPFPSGVPKDANELIVPARDGTLRVLRAAREAGVKRVVLTSSFAAIGYGFGRRTEPFTEADWTDPDAPGVQPYPRSKTLAERAAWELRAQDPDGPELAVVNPVAVFGPVLGPDLSTSILIVKRMLEGSIPGCPDLWFGGVDVRDVADLHLRAMTDPAASGERFLATGGDFISMLNIAQILKESLGEAARKVQARRIPSWWLRTAAPFHSQVRGVLPELGKRKNASNEKARRVLGWTPRSTQESIVATARSLLDLGLVKTAG